jgi:hypothetical protein
MKLRRWAAISACAVITLLPSAAAMAEDYNAELAYRLFTATCMRRVGKAEQIRAWASEVRLPSITDPNALNTFVGTASGPKGAAWALPSPNGRKFTLSLRSGSLACALFAETGDPKTAVELFRKMVEASAGEKSKVTVDEDLSFTTASGKSRLLTMSVEDKDGGGYQFTLRAGDQPGAFFSGAPVQISMQIERMEPAKK